MRWRGRKVALACLCALVCFISGLGLVCRHYAVPPLEFPMVATRALAAPLLGIWHRQDLLEVERRVRSYYVGPPGCSAAPSASWQKAASTVTALRIEGGNGLQPLPEGVPFVYGSPAAPPLRELVHRYRLRALVPGDGEEQGGLLRLAAWVGTRWDHGVDPLPNERPTPGEVIAAGANGSRFWCEIAARTTVQAATALGWPARLVTASSDGYHWNHALAEVWSNQFNKWVLVDTDYNVLYSSRGVPLSAFEICHRAPALSREGALQVVRFAPLKKSLKEQDLLFLYRYVHIDLRNDWLDRPLGAGSPAGGDRATWWTARPDLGPLLTAKTRVDSEDRFDWKVNAVALYALQLLPLGPESYRLAVGLRGYSPYFRAFEARLDGQRWQQVQDGRWSVTLGSGRHVIEARVVTGNGSAGPVYRVAFSLNRAIAASAGPDKERHEVRR